MLSATVLKTVKKPKVCHIFTFSLKSKNFPTSNQLDFRIDYRPLSGRFFNPIIDIKDIDFCSFFTNPIFLTPMLKIGKCYELFPELCHKCPYQAGEKVHANITVWPQTCPLGNNVVSGQRPTLKQGFWFPDGDYRATIVMHSEHDRRGMVINYYFKVKVGDSSGF
jgi:hypothetical protein